MMATKRKQKPRCAAVVTIRKPGKMSARGRKDIAGWLRQHATHIMKHGKDYTDGTFTGRFFYT